VTERLQGDHDTRTVFSSWAEYEGFLEEHPHEAAEVRFVESILQPGMKALDVGANIGVTTMAIARGIGQEGEVYAFEPVPRYFHMLERNVSVNSLNNVKAFPLAVTDHAGRVELYDNDLSSGIVSGERAPKLEVTGTTIDGFIQDQALAHIDVIAMDCEGSELLALRGAENTLRTCGPSVFCEIHHGFLSQLGQSASDIAEYLQQFGFEVRALCDTEMRTADSVASSQYLFAYRQQRGPEAAAREWRSLWTSS
jgi:FkbM family methyltransferase